MNRREFAKLTALGAAAAASACTLKEEAVLEIAESCSSSVAPDEKLRIDMHCHLMNLTDGNSAAFLNRHKLQKEEPSIVAEVIATPIVSLVDRIARLAVDSLDSEIRFLNEMHETGSFTNANFCASSSRRQSGVFLSNDTSGANTPLGKGRLTGFLSNRTRNASLMMAMWPEVDLFMPSMVDFYEVGPGGLWGDSDPHPDQRMYFYEALNRATRGRFVPFVSFHPEREMKDRSRSLTQLQMVEKAIRELGFVGVKVHPTAGFDPLDNEKYGCPNTWLQLRKELTEKEKIGYQKAMEELYALCDRLDVPILTHGGDGVTAHAECMHGRSDDPLDWTASTKHWTEAVDMFVKDDGFSVCLGHFASDFRDHLKEKAGDYKGINPPVEYDEDGRLIPSAWLKHANQYIKKHPDGRVWLDLSCMPAIAYSQKSGEETDRSNRRKFFGSGGSDGGKFAKAFTDFLQRNPHLYRRTMYGTDWHMPGASMAGPEYLKYIEASLPEASRRDIMGLNAARFAGLTKGSLNRNRLENYYDKHGIREEEVRWMRRVDQQQDLTLTS
jgi:predicted TIM-barrel fold metal-dependent hydrolase